MLSLPGRALHLPCNYRLNFAIYHQMNHTQYSTPRNGTHFDFRTEIDATLQQILHVVVWYKYCNHVCTSNLSLNNYYLL